MQVNKGQHTDDSIIVTQLGTGREVVPSFAVSLEEIEQRINLLKEFVRKHMILGEDYGHIPGVPKPTLLKPGAEKLCDVYGLSKLVDITNRIEDFEKGFFHYEVKVTLINKKTNMIEAEGVGSCNSKEKKYRYQDPFTLVNTFLKMAKKRALIDAVLSATRSSGLFTQDVEDLELETASKKKEEVKKFEESEATEKQKKLIRSLAKQKGLSDEELQKLCFSVTNKEGSKDWTKEDASNVIQVLYEYKVENMNENVNKEDKELH